MLKDSGFALSVFLFFAPLPAQAHLQCVPYARSVSGIDIHGDARTWWGQAQGKYQRGTRPQANSVLVFQASRAMPLGHVAVVRAVIDERRVLLDHANWSKPGMIERGALAVDISEEGDWSEVRVWYGPARSLGLRANPAYGFIYTASAPVVAPAATMAAADRDGGDGDGHADRTG